MKTPTVEEFKTWAKTQKDLALAVCQAQAFAECEKERVEAYIRPIFDRYTFIDKRTSERITNPDWLYCSEQEELCNAYYDECDKAHREHGFRGPHGNWPDLEAKTLQIKAEKVLLEAGSELMGIEDITLYGENREKMLKLLLGACLIKEKKAA